MDELRGHREKTGIYCFINKGMLASAGHDFTFDPGKKDHRSVAFEYQTGNRDDWSLCVSSCF